MKIKSIKSKVIFAVVGLILFFGFLAVTVTYTLVRDTLSSIKQDDLLSATINQTHEAREIFKQSSLLVESIAKNSGIVDMLENPDESSEAYKHVVDHRLLDDYNVGGRYLAIYFMDKNGNTIDSTDASFIDKNYSFRDYFQSAIKGEPYLDVSIGVTSKKLGYYFSHPVRGSTGEVVGVVVVKQSPKPIHDSIIDGLRGESKVMLVDKYGVVIFTNDGEKKFRSLGPLSTLAQEEIFQKKRYSDVKIEPLDYEEILNSLSNLTGPQSFTIEDDIDGEKESLVLVKIGETPFYLVGEVNSDLAESYAANTAIAISSFVIVAVFASAILISFLVTRFLRPISELSRVADAIGDGNLGQRASVESGDELEQLADSFNKMTDQLVNEKEGVENKVKERTLELEKLNKSMVGRELEMIELKKKVASLSKKIKSC